MPALVSLFEKWNGGWECQRYFRCRVQQIDQTGRHSGSYVNEQTLKKKNDSGMTAKMRRDAFRVDADDWIMALNASQHYLSLWGCESTGSVCHAECFLCLSLKAFVLAVHSGQTAWRRNLSCDTFFFFFLFFNLIRPREKKEIISESPFFLFLYPSCRRKCYIL